MGAAGISSPSPALSKGKRAFANQGNPQTAINEEGSQQTEAFDIGDHVYRWFKSSGVRLQHHGIVVEVESIPSENDGPVQMLTIFDFTKTESQKEKDGCINVYVANANGWHKVYYGARENRLNGTSTPAQCDPPDLVIQRVNFLRKNSIIDRDGDRIPQSIPHYDIRKANCECVALWCKTGRFVTLQVAMALRPKRGLASVGVAATLLVGTSAGEAAFRAVGRACTAVDTVVDGVWNADTWDSWLTTTWHLNKAFEGSGNDFHSSSRYGVIGDSGLWQNGISAKRYLTGRD